MMLHRLPVDDVLTGLCGLRVGPRLLQQPLLRMQRDRLPASALHARHAQGARPAYRSREHKHAPQLPLTLTRHRAVHRMPARASHAVVIQINVELVL